jgi:hypothetical protein
MQFFPDASFGEDPQPGASINYWLNEKNDSVKLHITNIAGDTVRTIKHKGKPGLNRVWWNFAGDKVTEIKMRTTPEGGDWMSLGKDRTRNSPFTLGYSSYWMPPGKYNVKMTVEGSNFSEEITILKDPNTEGSLDDITAQTEFMSQIHEDIDTASKMVNELELLRRQLYDLKAILKVQNNNESIMESLNEVDSLLTGLEGKMVQLKATGTGQDAVRWPSMLVEKLNYLAGTTAIGDFPPADQYREVYAVLKERLSSYQSEMETIMNGTFATFLDSLKANGIDPIVRKQE